MTNGWQSPLFGLAGDFIVVDDPAFAARPAATATTTTTTPEPDDSLRSRLLYVSGDSEARVRAIMAAKGAQLDALAEEIGLKRRGGT